MWEDDGMWGGLKAVSVLIRMSGVSLNAVSVLMRMSRVIFSLIFPSIIFYSMRLILNIFQNEEETMMLCPQPACVLWWL